MDGRNESVREGVEIIVMQWPINGKVDANGRRKTRKSYRNNECKCTEVNNADEEERACGCVCCDACDERQWRMYRKACVSKTQPKNQKPKIKNKNTLSLTHWLISDRHSPRRGAIRRIIRVPMHESTTKSIRYRWTWILKTRLNNAVYTKEL